MRFLLGNVIQYKFLNPIYPSMSNEFITALFYIWSLLAIYDSLLIIGEIHLLYLNETKRFSENVHFIF